MGKDAQVRASFAEGQDAGRLQYEAPRLLFRGTARRVFEGDTLKGVRAEAGDLVLPDGSRFTLGEKAAATWADSILNPRSRLDKLGVKPGMRVAVLNVADETLTEELAARDAAPTADLTDLDLLFYAADSLADLEALPKLIPPLGQKGALWIVSRKGKPAALKDVEVMAAARAVGLVDSKVVGFSQTLTALRFTRRR